MQNPLLKEKLIATGFTGEKVKVTPIRKYLKKIAERVKKSEKRPAEKSVWLSENFYLIERAVRETARIKPEKYSPLLALTDVFAHECVKLENDYLSALFDVITREGKADDTLLASVRYALIYSCVAEISERCDSEEKIGEKIELLRAVMTFDMSSLIMGFSASERYLRSDPAGIWQKMSRSSRLLYKTSLKKMARREGESYEKVCESVALRASENSRHIGEYIDFTNSSRFLYYPLLFVLFLIFMALSLRFLLPTCPAYVVCLATVCLAVPFFETSCTLAGFAVSLFYKSGILPRIEIDGIEESVATLAVVTALVSNAAEAEELISRTENLYLKSKSRDAEDEDLFFGVLMDLPESDSPIGKDDGEILKVSLEKVDFLNKKHGGHFEVFWRDRVYDASSGRYTAYERKRGALLELTRFSLKKPSSIHCHGAPMPKIRYIVTLDSDTDMCMGDLAKLVGTMEHPLNRPRLAEKDGVFYVKEGFGILQPAVLPSLSSAYKTPFSILTSGAGGHDAYHSPIFNLFFTLHRRAMFCGKGIFDTECYLKVLENAFPDNTVLSHDMLEGSRLRAGFVGDIVFSDSTPGNIISYYKRAHRWARGDTQALIFTTPHVCDRHGRRVKNVQPLSDRFVFVFNFLSLLSPAFSLCALLLAMNLDRQAGTFIALAALLPVWVYYVTGIFMMFVHLSFVTLFRRFFTRAVTGCVREFAWLVFSLSALAYRAWNNFHAVCLSLFRLAVTRRKLLEWNTAQAVESSLYSKDGIVGYFFYTLPSFLTGVFIVIFSSHPLVRLFGILFMPFFLIGFLTAKRVGKSVTLSGYDEKKLRLYAEKTWNFFDTFLTEFDNMLPCDNVSISPEYKVAHHTSPTNIGLWLLCALASRDLGLINSDSLARRLEKTLEALEKMPKCRGHLYNWYSTRTLEIVGDAYISTVDSGNFAVCLATLVQGLYEYAGECPKLFDIVHRFEKLERNIDFKFLYDSHRRLFYIGYDADKREYDNSHYDLYMSEVRTLCYYSVARGIADKRLWESLSRSLIARRFLIGAASWSGTAFEYFMPCLFLPVYENSFAQEALSFAFTEQVCRFSRFKGMKVWGTSESGYFAFDRDMNYQYRAFGVPSLALSGQNDSDRVISPYSSFLMLRENVSLCIENLENLEKLGMFGEYGFYEAADFSPERSGGGFAMVKSYMSHHAGMSLIAIANTLLNDIFVSRFMRDSEMKSASELLEERVPTDALIFSRNKIRTREREVKLFHLFLRDSLSVCKNSERAATHILAGRECFMALSERGVETFSGRDILYSSPRKNSFIPFCREGEKIFSTVTAQKEFCYSSGFAVYRTKNTQITFNLSASSPAVRINTAFDTQGSESGFYFEPAFVPYKAYVAHPTYAELFFEGRWDGEKKALYLTYHGKKPYSLCLLCNCEFEFELFRETVFDKKEANARNLFDYIKNTPKFSCTTGTLLSPCILARTSCSAGAFFVMGFGKSENEAFYAAYEELSLSRHRSLSLSDGFERRLWASSCVNEFNRPLDEFLLFSLRESTGMRQTEKLPPIYSQKALWKWGISGDLPIVFVSGALKEETLEKIFAQHKYHYIAGVRYDIALVCCDYGYMRTERERVMRVLKKTGCSFMQNQPGGIYLLDKDAWDTLRLCAKVVIERESDIISLPAQESFSSETQKRRENSGSGEYGFSNGKYTVNKSIYTPPVLWHHIIASDGFGTLVTSRNLGHTWAYNAGLSRLTFWENDRVGGERSEKIYLSQDGYSYDMCDFADRVEFSPGEARYLSSLFEVRVSVSPTLMYKEVSVKLFTQGEISLFYKIPSVMGDGTSKAGGVVFEKISCGIKFANPFSESFEKGFGYLVSDGEVFYSPYGLGVKKTVFKGEEIKFFIGFARGEKHFERALARAFSGSCEKESREYAAKFLPKCEKSVFNGSEEEMFKTFIPLQCVFSRIIARTGPYQSGGAWGCRDQTQDMFYMINVCPERVASHLFRLASHQYLEGDMQHWWHGFRGTRTKCSDDYLWFVLLLSEYAERTGDGKIFEKKVRYLQSSPLAENESERYEEAEFSSCRENLVMHAKRCLDLFLSRGRGVHGIVLMGSGDWNDGMNRVGQGGGESVWLGFFAVSVFYRAFPLLERFGIETEEYRKFCRDVICAIEKHAFETDRYVRAFLSDSSVLGSKSFEGGCKIDGIVSSAASVCHALSSLGSPSRICASLDTSWRELYDGENKIFKLFSPPFEKTDDRVGYVTCYPQGIRENGGQYTHAAIFSAIGYYFAPAEKKKNRERARLILEAVLPCNRNPDVFKTEPYALAADIYSNPSHEGRGGWSFYTGSAGWCEYLMNLFSKENPE